MGVEGRGKESQTQNVQEQCFLQVFLMLHSILHWSVLNPGFNSVTEKGVDVN